MVLLLAGSMKAQVAHFEGPGRLAAIDLGGELVWIGTDVRVWAPGPVRKADLGPMAKDDLKFSETGGRRNWTGSMFIDHKRAFTYEQTVTEEGSEVRLQFKLASETDAPLENVQFVVVLPLDPFGGGTCSLPGPDGAPAAPITLPKEPGEANQLAAAQGGRRAVAADAEGKVRLDVSVEGPGSGPEIVQDCRPSKLNRYEVLFTFPPPAKGESLTVAARLKLTGEPDRKPVALRLDANRPLYRLDGLGGNYCFGMGYDDKESPANEYTLTNLNVGWGRIEFTAGQWWPEANTIRPSDNDKPDSKTRYDLDMAQRMSAKGIPYVVTVWRLPEWLYAEPGKGPDVQGRIVPRERWSKMTEVIGSYLLYAKQKYGAEPRLFSFNEADLGVYVKFSPEEGRDLIKLLGAHFAKLGLRTKMLLGDTASPGGLAEYVRAALADEEAMKYVGAIAFHSWGGARPAEYEAISGLATRQKLPLLVSEVGLDPQAWSTPWVFDDWFYALREMQLYQELLLYARPQGTMQWEFNEDYRLVTVKRPRGGKPEVLPTARFWVMKHFCNLTPRPAEALEGTSDCPSVLFTAFRGAEREKGKYALHIANLSGASKVTIQGLPPGVRSLQAVRSTQREQFKSQGPFPVKDGAAALELPAQSLTTLSGQAE
jgi:hypothetical protein